MEEFKTWWREEIDKCLTPPTAERMAKLAWEAALKSKTESGANVRLVSTDKHPDLIAWEKEHNKPLHLGCKVIILETCEYFEEDYDRGKTFIVVMMYVDSGGLNMGLSDGQNDNYLCETDGYYIADLVPA